MIFYWVALYKWRNANCEIDEQTSQIVFAKKIKNLEKISFVCLSGQLGASSFGWKQKTYIFVLSQFIQIR